MARAVWLIVLLALGGCSDREPETIPSQQYIAWQQNPETAKVINAYLDKILRPCE